MSAPCSRLRRLLPLFALASLWGSPGCGSTSWILDSGDGSTGYTSCTVWVENHYTEEVVGLYVNPSEEPELEDNLLNYAVLPGGTSLEPPFDLGRLGVGLFEVMVRYADGLEESTLLECEAGDDWNLAVPSSPEDLPDHPAWPD
jgi:hypothetical protein